MLRSPVVWALLFMIGCTPIRPLDAPADAAPQADAQPTDASADSGVSVDSAVSVDACSAHLELCNGVDDDCDPLSADGSEDPMLGMPCDGGDADSCTEGTYACTDGAFVCSDATDDTLETCSGAMPGEPMVDEDCDGMIDEDGAVGSRPFYPDADHDGYGDDEGVRMMCAQPIGGWDSEGGDCDDTDERVRPGRSEACNAIDDDCDGTIDEGSPCSGCDTFTYGGHAYQICSRNRRWSEARMACMDMGYDLVVIQDDAEETAVEMELASPFFTDAYWIGLSQAAGDEFTWVDGSPLTYSDWADGQPNGTGTCVRITRMFGLMPSWADDTCGTSLNYVCEQPD